MDMNAFRKHLAQRAEEQGTVNKPRHRAFGSALDSVNSASIESHTEIDFSDVEEVYSGERMAAKTRQVRANAAKNLKAIAKRKKEEKAGRRPPRKPNNVGERGGSYGSQSEDLDGVDESLTGRDIVEAFEIVNMFCESIMEEHGLNEESEDIDAIIEEALNLLDLDEDYGKMPTVSQSLSDKDKLKVQKGEKSQMPKAGVEDKLPGEQQSSIDAIKAVLGSKKGSAAGSAY